MLFSWTVWFLWEGFVLPPWPAADGLGTGGEWPVLCPLHFACIISG